MHSPCIAWDGKTLMALESRQWDTFLYARINGGGLVLDGGKLGTIYMLALCAPFEYMAKIREFLEVHPLDEFIRFYRMAASQGLTGKNFKFQLMAVIDRSVGYLEATSLDVSCQGVQIRRDNCCLSVGKDAYAAMLLMGSCDRSADEAVFAQALMDDRFQQEPCGANGVYYDCIEETFHARTRRYHVVASSLAMMRTCNLDPLLKVYPCAPQGSGTTMPSGPGNDTSTPM
jgi:hypothetical protein